MLVMLVELVDLVEVVQVMVVDQQDQKILEEVQPLLVLQYMEMMVKLELVVDQVAAAVLVLLVVEMLMEVMVNH
jgi:hypothetical protein